MTKVTPARCVVCIAGLDPSGGAGLLADVSTLAGLGVHAAGAATTLTVQDSVQLYTAEAVAPDLLAAQLQTLASDMRIDAIKVGAVGSTDNVAVIAEFLDWLNKPCVWDPVAEASAGLGLNSSGSFEAAVDSLLPRATVVTPNENELQMLLDATGTAQATDLLRASLRTVVVTGCGDERAIGIDSYDGDGRSTHRLPRLEGEFRGTGCRFASALAAGLARGAEPAEAARAAQQHTHALLQNSSNPGHGSRMPGLGQNA